MEETERSPERRAAVHYKPDQIEIWSSDSTHQKNETERPELPQKAGTYGGKVFSKKER